MYSDVSSQTAFPRMGFVCTQIEMSRANIDVIERDNWNLVRRLVRTEILFQLLDIYIYFLGTNLENLDSDSDLCMILLYK